MKQAPKRLKPSLVALAAVLTVSAMLALPASASFDHRFWVRSKSVPTQPHPPNQRIIRFRSRLTALHDHHDRVGHERGKCRLHSNTSEWCRLRINLDGEIGGTGVRIP